MKWVQLVVKWSCLFQYLLEFTPTATNKLYTAVLQEVIFGVILFLK